MHKFTRNDPDLTGLDLIIDLTCQARSGLQSTIIGSL